MKYAKSIRVWIIKIFSFYTRILPESAKLFDSWYEKHDGILARKIKRLREFWVELLDELAKSDPELTLRFIEALRSPNLCSLVRAMELPVDGKDGSIEDLARAYKHSPTISKLFDSWYEKHPKSINTVRSRGPPKEILS